MMYADRYGSRKGFNPGALALSLGGTALFLFGLSLTAPHFTQDPIKVLRLIKVYPDPLPSPKEQPRPRPKEAKTIDAPRPDHVEVTKPVVEAAAGGNAVKPVDVGPAAGEAVGIGTGTLPAQPIHLPVEFAPQLDQRYAASFQPDYPLGERQAEHEGRVVVRVLIGTDGRVKAVEQVSAASRAFFEATRKRALEKWRFTPGTRDGVPVEAWREVGVSFTLQE